MATARSKNAWTVELAVPWPDMMVSPPLKETKMGFLLARILPAGKCSSGEVLQYPPLNGKNHRIELFGNLELK